MEPAKRASEPEILMTAKSMTDQPIAKGKFVNEFHVQHEIERVNAIFTRAEALVSEIVASVDR